MRIAIISTIASGGAATAALNTHRALCAAGQDSVVCLLETRGEDAFSLSWPGPATTEQNFWTEVIFTYWQSLTKLEKLRAGGTELFSDNLLALHGLSPQAAVAIAQADIINLHWVAGVLPSPELIPLLLGKRIVLTLHDMNAFTGGCHYHISCRRFESECGNCPLLEHPSATDLSHQGFMLKKHIYNLLNPTIITPSRWLAQQVEASALLDKFPISVVPNAHDLETFRPLSEEKRLQLRDQLGIQDDALVVLTSSVDLKNPRKNLSMFFDAWRQLHPSDGAPLELLLAGYGELPDDIPGHSLGHIASPEQMAEMYNAADIFVHPSRIDNLPNTVCEAQCCGTPTITFNAGGSSEAFLAEESGFVVEEISSQALAKSLSTALNQPVRLKSMRARAREFAEKKFTLASLAEKYLEVFAGMSGNTARATPAELDAILRDNQASSLADLMRVSALQTGERILRVEQSLFGTVQKTAGTEQKLTVTEQKLLGTEQKLLGTEQKLLGTEQKLLGTEQKLLGTEQKIVGAEQKIAEAEQKIAEAEQKIAEAERKMVDTEQKITYLEQRLVHAEKKLRLLRVFTIPLQAIKKLLLPFINR